MENDSAQLNETQRAVNEQIAGAFRVPVSKIGDLSKANYSNMEVSEQVYVTSTLDPYYRSGARLPPRPADRPAVWAFSVQFDRSVLTANDTKALHVSLCQGIQNGIYSQNDARRKLGENPIPKTGTLPRSIGAATGWRAEGGTPCCLTWNGDPSSSSALSTRRYRLRRGLRDALARPGGFVEVVKPQAVDRAVHADIVALFNHDQAAVLGRTPATLRLEKDRRGLAFTLDPAPTQAGQDAFALVRRGDVKGASFGFRTLKDAWRREAGLMVRELLDIEIAEISLTAFPAYRDTDVTSRSGRSGLCSARSIGSLAPTAREGVMSDEETRA